MRAVIPCAGMGTRLAPLTRAVPKELLPLGSRCLLDHLLAELEAAGIGPVVAVVRREKPALLEHLQGRGVELAWQERPDGLGSALAAARPLVGDAPFLMALPDQLLAARPGASAQLVAAYGGQASLSSLVRVSPACEAFFPGCRGFALRGGRVTGLLPPGREGLWRGFGRTIFDGTFLARLTDRHGEAAFAQAFEEHLRTGEHVAVRLQGRPLDVGTLAGYRYYWRQLPRLERDL